MFDDCDVDGDMLKGFILICGIDGCGFVVGVGLSWGWSLWKLLMVICGVFM